MAGAGSALVRDAFVSIRFVAAIAIMVILVTGCDADSTAEPTPAPLALAPSPLASPTLPAYPGWTAAPSPVPVAAATPTAPPTRVVLPTSPKCEHFGQHLRCSDEMLGLRFTYPSSWGHLQGYLSEGACGGYAYRFEFDNLRDAPRAGGASIDYCEPMGGDITLFRGFTVSDKLGERTVDGCTLFTAAASCQRIGDHVLIVTLLPDVNALCDPAPGVIYAPIMIVAVDLPDDARIHGLAFVMEFLSTKARDSLFAPLGGLSINRQLCDDPATRQRFEQAVQTLAKSLATGAVDEETAYKVQLIQEFAASIELLP